MLGAHGSSVSFRGLRGPLLPIGNHTDFRLDTPVRAPTFDSSSNNYHPWSDAVRCLEFELFETGGQS
jgi:hypothetical protein